jgi:hypothetical protein
MKFCILCPLVNYLVLNWLAHSKHTWEFHILHLQWEFCKLDKKGKLE